MKQSERSFPALSRKRYCVIVPALFALSRRRMAMRHLQRGLSSGKVPRKFFEELFLHLSLVLGFPMMLEGLRLLQEVSGPRKSQRASVFHRSEGRRVLAQIYGAQTGKLLKNLSRLHPDVPGMILKDVYGKVFVRPGLSLEEREIINITVLAIQGLERQLFSHVRGILRAGGTKQTLELIERELRRITGKRFAILARMVRSVVSQGKKW